MEGIFLGGMAEGFSAGREEDIAKKTLGLRERMFEADEKRTADAEVDKHIGGTLKVIADAIKGAREAGASPDKIRALIAPLQKDIEEISHLSGRDPRRFLNAIEAQINVPVAPTLSPDAKIAEQVRQEALKKKLRVEAGLEKGDGGGVASGTDTPTREMTTAQKNELARGEAAVISLMKELDGFEKLVEEGGAGANPYSAYAGKVTQSRRNLQLQLKELFNLGVLNGPDLELMDSLIPDPMLDLNPIGGGGVNIPINIKERSREMLAQLRGQINTMIEAKREAFAGVKSTGRAAAPVAAGNSDVLDEAREAIANGAPRDAVIQRLREMGIDPAGL